MDMYGSGPLYKRPSQASRVASATRAVSSLASGSAPSSAATLPFVFILDWDGTIAGRVEYQSHAYTLMQTLKRQGVKSVPGYNPAAAFGRGTKLIRPGFAAFVRGLREFYGAEQVHFFIYTASEKQWAHHEIAIVEKEHDFQFARPLFTRDDCIVDTAGSYKKSIAKIFPRVLRAMARDRPFTKNEKDYILSYQTLVIDNNAVYSDHTDKLLLCPDYNYCVFENVLDVIPRSAWQNPAVVAYIRGMISSGVACPQQCAAVAATSPRRGGPSGESGASGDADAGASGADYVRTLVESYTWLAVKCKKIQDENEAYASDDFWRYLKKMIVGNVIRNYSRHTVQQLQNAVWRRAQKSPKQAATPGSGARHTMS